MERDWRHQERVGAVPLQVRMPSGPYPGSPTRCQVPYGQDLSSPPNNLMWWISSLQPHWTDEETEVPVSQALTYASTEEAWSLAHQMPARTFLTSLLIWQESGACRILGCLVLQTLKLCIVG